MRRKPLRTPERTEIATLHIDVEEVPKPTGPIAKILLLEDRSDFRSVLRDFLDSCSYQVTSASSGVEGLNEVMKARFDVILCDMMMPQMGGEMFYWAVTRVRPATKDRFIFFTGHKNNPTIEFFFQRINATVLFKPFNLSSLDTAIREVVRKHG